MNTAASSRKLASVGRRVGTSSPACAVRLRSLCRLWPDRPPVVLSGRGHQDRELFNLLCGCRKVATSRGNRSPTTHIVRKEKAPGT